MNVNELRSLLKEEQALTESNDGLWASIFERKVALLCENLTETITFLDNCTAEEFFWISNAFEDVSAICGTPQFLASLRRNQKRFPHMAESVGLEIDYAVQAMCSKAKQEKDENCTE